jgi:signal transduction histidine kinase
MARWLWVAVAVMVFGLLGLIGVVHAALRDVATMNGLIARDTAPGVVALHAMAVDASRLRVLLRESLSPSSDMPALRARAAETRQALGLHANAWFSLPIDPGEAEMMDEFRHAARRMDELTGAILATSRATPAAQREALRRELDARGGALEAVILGASELNAELAAEATRVADRVGRRLLPAGIAVEATSLALGMFALYSAYRVNRTEAALAERRLLQQRNAELEAFSGRVAHDVLSPLMTVSIAVGRAAHQLSRPGDEPTHSMLARAASALGRVRQVVSDLLDFARSAGPPLPVETAVAPLVQTLVQEMEPVAAEAGVSLCLTGVATVRVRCAAGILSSILSNLIRNAIEHAGMEEHRVDVRAIEAGPSEVRFEVEDTGPGVPLEDRQRIFEPYVRARDPAEGLGLGLATVKRLVEAYGGHVGVRSPAAREHGSVFWVTLPAA